MKVLVIGAAGMIGRKLCRAAGARRRGWRGRRSTSAHLVDVVAPGAARGAVSGRPRSLRHRRLLCAAEAGRRPAGRDLPARLGRVGRGGGGLRQGLRHQSRRDADDLRGDPARARRSPAAPIGRGSSSPRRSRCSARRSPRRSATSSSPTPLTSYGTQKAICELLLADYSRRGFFDGIGLRLPTICVRPGAPNKAASGFFSGIIREPLAGKEAILPVGDDVRHWHASPRVGGRIPPARGRDSTPRSLGARRTLNLPGVSATVGEQIEALRRVAGDEGGEADPPRAGRDDRAHRRRLAEELRPHPGQGSRFSGG